ncbi:MAG TPA: ABC transporter permease [Candidatus Acidoferrales bacterium]|nr:ABC transporter permease [Candidatus Acidoferrales bacterium]
MRDWRAHVRAHLPALHARPEREAEIVAELALQLEQAYEEALAGGANEAGAMAHAESLLGDWRSLARGIDREERRPRVLAGTGGDFRYAIRFLRRNPVFTLAAAATLAFGIGGNTAVFTLADTLLLRALPYRAPEQLVAIETRKSQQPEIEPWTSAADFFDFRDRARSYSALAAVSPVWSVVLTGRGPAEQLDALFVSAAFFPMLGVNAELGRTFASQDDPRAPGSSVVMLSYGYWQRRFGGSRQILGKSLTLDGRAYTVIGVLPKKFGWAGEPMTGRVNTIDVWFPLAANQLVGSVRSVRYLKLAGRLRPGVTARQASEEARRVGTELAAEYPASNRGFDWDARSLEGMVTGRVRSTMLLLAGAVAFVLLMACANTANLLLARGAARQKEIAVRVALGASRTRLIRQLLIEGLTIALLGACAGIPLAWAALAFFGALGPDSLIQGRTLGLDARALAVTGGAALICALLAGMPPALRMSGRDPAHALQAAGRGLVAGHRRLRSFLVAGQIAVALVLLVGAGLLIRSFRNLLEVRPGIDPHNLAAIQTQLPSTARSPEQRRAMWERIRTRLEATPGVAAAAAVSRLPFAGANLGVWVFAEGKHATGEPGMDAEYRVCTDNYFAVMGIPLLAGRGFDSRDDSNPASVIIVNQTLARRLWPGADPVGKRIKIGANPESSPWVNVIGVAGDVRHFGLETPARPELYRTYAVNPLGAPNLVVRTRVDAAALLGELSARVRALDPDMPAYGETLMERLVERSTAQRRFVMLLLAGFALSALLVAGAGIYGMISEAVAQRTAEIGLRMALGAAPGNVIGMIFSEGLRLVGMGFAAGTALAAALAWVMRGMLFATGPLDPTAYLGAAVVLGMFALAACYIPARRATRVDPMCALRQQN